MAAKEWIDDKIFRFRNYLWSELEGNYFLWRKTFKETSNRLCKASTATNKRNDRLREILFLETYVNNRSPTTLLL